MAFYSAPVNNVGNSQISPTAAILQTKLAKHGCVLNSTTDPTVIANEDTYPIWETEVYDTHSYHPANAAYMVAPEPGVYIMEAGIRWAAGTAGLRALGLDRGTTGASGGTITRNWDDNAISTLKYMTVGRKLFLEEDQAIRMYLRCSGANIIANRNGITDSYLSMHLDQGAT